MCSWQHPNLELFTELLDHFHFIIFSEDGRHFTARLVSLCRLGATPRTRGCSINSPASPEHLAWNMVKIKKVSKNTINQNELLVVEENFPCPSNPHSFLGAHSWNLHSSLPHSHVTMCHVRPG